ncbi:hypothetical protein VB734_10490 [Synechococcus sp. BA-124 BA4]|uniref:hypothetical protein n=1 Tax=Synechococcus sp. BA-124 BA4 TaxID=3110251 RepID=UPI002B1FC4EF|nr:hypothetical protein [Synechococcus sp. BA-124 BA4]MEA5400465.1 hypothetical protein [Synechococcus sp. BA-124 BA4]
MIPTPITWGLDVHRRGSGPAVRQQQHRRQQGEHPDHRDVPEGQGRLQAETGAQQRRPDELPRLEQPEEIDEQQCRQVGG